MDLAGDLVQSLGSYLGIEDLATTCSFPRQQERVEELLTTAEDLQATRQRLGADMADHSGVIRWGGWGGGGQSRRSDGVIGPGAWWSGRRTAGSWGT